jgi:hypothetical protein
MIIFFENLEVSLETDASNNKSLLQVSNNVLQDDKLYSFWGI